MMQAQVPQLKDAELPWPAPINKGDASSPAHSSCSMQVGDPSTLACAGLRSLQRWLRIQPDFWRHGGVRCQHYGGWRQLRRYRCRARCVTTVAHICPPGTCQLLRCQCSARCESSGCPYLLSPPDSPLRAFQRLFSLFFVVLLAEDYGLEALVQLRVESVSLHDVLSDGCPMHGDASLLQEPG
jgi:hypothetical protein